MKYQRKKSIATFLGTAMARQLRPWLNERGTFTCILPVPTTDQTRRYRGFNQTDLIAQTFRDELTIPFLPDLLQRRLKTAHRYTLNREERRKNMEGVFEVPDPKRYSQNILQKVLLIDDVYTTGSTVTACARALQKAGVPRNSIFVATLCRVYNLPRGSWHETNHPGARDSYNARASRVRE